MAAGERWSRADLLLALNLYLRLPFGRMHHGNPEVVALAAEIGRTPSSVALRLSNYVHLDPALDRQGMSGVGPARKVWDEYEADPEGILIESEGLKARRGLESLVTPEEIATGRERDVVVRARVNQAAFRRLILARYDNTCCVTGLRIPEVLVAAHIVPWATDAAARLDPRNGLCLNGLHDLAFERGLIVVDDEFRVRVSPQLSGSEDGPIRQWLGRLDRQPLRLVGDTTPSQEFLRRHRERFEWSAAL